MIRLSKSVVGKEESIAVSNVIENIGYLGMGDEVLKFESELDQFIANETNYRCVCVNTGTSALHLSLEAITSIGDEVLVPSYTYIASYQAISAAGCIPISCDINESNLLIDLADAAKRITSKTKVIMPVLFASNPDGLDDVYKFAKNNNLRVVEDAAHAFGCYYKGKKIGSQGDIICFSFDGIKNITSGEGGAVFSSDAKVIQKIKDARLLGVEKDTERRFKGKRSWDFDVKRQGYRYHMSNIFAAIGRVQLKKFEDNFAPIRIKIANNYVNSLKNSKNVKLIKMKYGKIIPHIFPILILNQREKIISKFKKEKIQFGMHYKPNHLLTKYKSGYNLPICEKIYSQIMTLPIHPDLSSQDVNRICSIIKNI